VTDSRRDAGLAELDRQRDDSERRYHDALSALDRAVAQVSALLTATAEDAAALSGVNHGWDIYAPVAADSPLRARLRRLLAPLVRPALGPQRAFNAAVAAQVTRIRQHMDATAEVQAHVIWYAQTVATFIDARHRPGSGLREVDVLHATLSALTDDWLKRWETLGAREARYESRHAALTSAYDELKDLVAIAQQSALTLKREVERLIAAGPAGAAAPAAAAIAAGSTGTAGTLDSFKYVGFEDRFRGSQAAIRERLASYLPLLAGASPVVELGSGRGEFLDLLREAGLTARGVDLNHEMVEVARARGLDVVEQDALTFLRAQADDSLGAVFAAQVAEHLEPGYLMTLIETAAHKLRRGGLLVLETINPACWTAFFESYLRDLTHVRALHPDTLQYLLRASGFHDVTIEFRSPIAEADRLQGVPQPSAGADPAIADLIDTFNANVDKLNARMFTFQDYAAIGRK
jgi:SAM-dependent methyltransferase